MRTNHIFLFHHTVNTVSLSYAKWKLFTSPRVTMARTNDRGTCALTLIFLLQYFELFAFCGSLISILRSAAPDNRRKFDVIFWANDGRRLLLKSFLHSFSIVLESNSVGLCNVSSSFSDDWKWNIMSAWKGKMIALIVDNTPENTHTKKKKNLCGDGPWH